MAKIRQYFAPIRRLTESNTGAEAWQQAARRLGSLGAEEGSMLRQTGDLGKQMVEELKGLIPIYSDHVLRGGGGMRVREPREPRVRAYEPSNAITADDIASGRFSADENGALVDENGEPASEMGLSMTRAAATLFNRYQNMQDRVDAHNAAVARQQAAADQRAQATQDLLTAKQNAVVDKSVDAERRRLVSENGTGEFSPLDQALSGDKDLKRLDAGAATAGMTGNQVKDYLNSRYGSDIGGRLYNQYQTDQYNKSASAAGKLVASQQFLSDTQNQTAITAAQAAATAPAAPADTYNPDAAPPPITNGQVIWAHITAAASGNLDALAPGSTVDVPAPEAGTPPAAAPDTGTQPPATSGGFLSNIGSAIANDMSQ